MQPPLDPAGTEWVRRLEVGEATCMLHCNGWTARVKRIYEPHPNGWTKRCIAAFVSDVPLRSLTVKCTAPKGTRVQLKVTPQRVDMEKPLLGKDGEYDPDLGDNTEVFRFKVEEFESSNQVIELIFKNEGSNKVYAITQVFTIYCAENEAKVDRFLKPVRAKDEAKCAEDIEKLAAGVLFERESSLEHAWSPSTRSRALALAYTNLSDEEQ